VPASENAVSRLLDQLVSQTNSLSTLPILGRGAETHVLDHVHPSSYSFLLAALARQYRQKTIWIFHELPRIRERIAMEMETWGLSAVVLPEPASEIADGAIVDPESEADRLRILELLAERKPQIILTHEQALTAAAPSSESLKKARISLSIGLPLDPLQFMDQLANAGYDRQSIVHARGQFANRGGIVDVFPWHAALPLRVEFFDSEIESLREYDPDSQLSTKRLKSVPFILHEPEKSATVLDYIKDDHIIIALEQIFEALPFCQIFFNQEVFDDDSLSHRSLPTFPSPLGVFEAGDFILQQAKRDQFFQQMQEWQDDHWTVAMSFANQGEEDRFRELAGSLDGIHAIRGDIHAGFIIPEVKIAVISSSELFGRYRSAGMTRKSLLDRHNAARVSLDEIQLADLVVHYEYGIGRFRGIQFSDEGDSEEIVIEYLDGALLSVPLDQAHLVAKYVGMGGRTPELNKLGSVSWKKTRHSAEKSILDYAAQILRIQAERQSQEGYSHPPDSRWMWEFENSFHFTETIDQLRAIEETKRDMETPKPMDRLICGDVGFGKTEVAIRAAFKAITGGKQVAILVPTTVLAEQHWRTFRERMSDYPIRIDLLNRFRTPAEVRDTIKGLADGSVDLIIGTHRLLSADVAYHNLGLVVIDEEQRFGVKHKDKFKEIFRHIDILTLSATPIPRTLYMALMGTRDMSTIDTPPPNRMPVHTSISPYDDRIIRDAILREMKRGGQVFFLYNRVKTIEVMRKKIQTLVPEARILVGHGQMDQDELEVVMKTFVQGEADVLLATTIIETGIDIPNANTILIDRADRFGLADLYQLRGRVGRAGEKAYAILLLPRDMMAQGDARKRINAIRQYTALGSGFKIAMRDLEIRGAGNLLGTKQSGHIAAVGFDLYCQLLRQSVERLKGRPMPQRAEISVRADFIAFTENEFHRGSADTELLPAYLPGDFITDTRLRVSAYRELAECLSEKDVDALLAGWKDRFGRLPEAVECLLMLTRAKIRAAIKKITTIEIRGQKLSLTRNGASITMENRHPRLKSTKPLDKLKETLHLLELL
jgi:transcription-repair coupling factor (superfamily II helicase)